ncbi:SUR7 family protein pun1 [Penicillium rolfsii]|nr:SUR7 family protein pun1 [Penicillium rolfsii]
MGKAGRVACIFTPYVLTIASLICIVMVGLGCTKSSSDTLNNLYFMRINLQNITSEGSETVTEIENLLEQYGISDVSAQNVSSVLSKLQQDSTLADFYQIGLWSYCDGDINNTKTTVKECSKPKSEFYFNPFSVWGLDSSDIKDELPSDYNKVMNTYKTVSKWMFIAYLVAFIATIAEIVVGFFAICSRWGSCVTTLVALVAFLFTAAASITSTVLFSIFKSSLGTTLKAYGIRLSMGKNIYVATWLAVAFSLGALIFWTFSVCCCSGRSPYGHRNNNPRSITAEKAPYTYEPLGAGQLPHGYQQPTSYPAPAAHGGEYPMTNTNQRSNAYEPFRHS